MGDCPVDLYKSPGTSCTEEIFPDDSAAKSNEDGKCYRGKCISQDGSCIDPNTGGAIYDGGTPHTSYCRQRLGLQHNVLLDGSIFGSCIGYSQPARDGMECGSRASSAARPPSTRTGHLGRASARNLVVRQLHGLERLPLVLRRRRLREPVCVGEEGTAADPTCFVCCEGAAPDMQARARWRQRSRWRRRSRPSRRGRRPCRPRPSLHPTLSPAPTGSPAPTTSLPPTEAPTTAQPSPAPTRAPTANARRQRCSRKTVPPQSRPAPS